MSLPFRCRAVLEPSDHDLRHIHISEIHSSMTHEEFTQQMADLVGAGVIRGVAGIRNESDRKGVRIIVELKPGADPQVVYEQLFS